MLMLVLVLEMRALQSTFILGSKDNGLNLNSFALSVQAMRRFSSTSTAALSTGTRGSCQSVPSKNESPRKYFEKYFSDSVVNGCHVELIRGRVLLLFLAAQCSHIGHKTMQISRHRHHFDGFMVSLWKLEKRRGREKAIDVQ
jgi:hypothetical protein